MLDTASGLYRNQFVVLVTIAAAMQGVPGIMGIYIDVSSAGIDDFSLLLAYLFVSILFSSVAVAASTFVISGAYLGDRVPAREALANALVFMLSLIIITLLSTLFDLLRVRAAHHPRADRHDGPRAQQRGRGDRGTDQPH